MFEKLVGLVAFDLVVFLVIASGNLYEIAYSEKYFLKYRSRTLDRFLKSRVLGLVFMLYCVGLNVIWLFFVGVG